MTAPSVLGVDPSLTATALCTISGAQSPAVAVSRSRPSGSDTPAKLVRLRHQQAAVVAAAHTADLVVIEGLSFGSKGSATRDLAGLWWLMVDALVRCASPVFVAAPSVLKKWTTGFGNANKFVVGQHIAKRWPAVELGSDDEADALALASMGLHHLGLLPWQPTANQTEQITRLEWASPRRPEPAVPALPTVTHTPRKAPS